MNRVAEFFKVSESIFIDSAGSCFPETGTEELRAFYRELSLPCRATKGSAGYDFFSPLSVRIEPGTSVTIPTGIRAKIEEGWALLIFPRSGLGFKYRMQLNNTVGVIDSDYYYSDNEGHIMIRLFNDSRENKVLNIEKGSRFAQGLFLPFGITMDDHTKQARNGGFGSTG